MDIQQLYQDYSVDYKTEGHKHTRAGWVNTACPWCVSSGGHEGYHLGYNLQSDRFVCWRCGVHPVNATIALILRLNYKEAAQIVQMYGLLVSPYETALKPIEKANHKFPSGVEPLQARHKQYLEERLFDPDYLEKKYNLLGTGPLAFLRPNDKSDKRINYKQRIIIPYFWDYQQVSFDSRDITGKSELKYIACPLEREVIPHKNILYGTQENWGKTGICVEGPTDVWRFGDPAFAVSGIKFTSYQVRAISKIFKRVAVCFDGGEPQALEQASLLVGDLRFRGVDAFRVDIEGDPGGMKQSEADYLVKQLTH